MERSIKSSQFYKNNRCRFWKDPGFFPKLAKCGIFLLACVSKSIVAQGNWKREVFGKIDRYFRKKIENFFKIAIVGESFIKRVSKQFLLQKPQKFQSWVFVGKQLGFLERKLNFLENLSSGQIWYRIRLKWWCFYWRFLQKFRVWLLGKMYGFFRKVHGDFQELTNSTFF